MCVFLTENHFLRLIAVIMSSPDAYEMKLFTKFVAKMMFLQKHLDLGYTIDKNLRYRLITAVDIPIIQVAFRVQMLHTAQQLVDRVEDRLSGKPVTTGSPSAPYARCLEIE